MCCVSEESVKILTLCSDRIKVHQSSTAVQSKLPQNETEKAQEGQRDLSHVAKEAEELGMRLRRIGNEAVKDWE